MVRIIGIDCAVQPQNMGLALGAWDAGTVSVEAITTERTTHGILDELTRWITTAEGPVLVGMDAPLAVLS